MNKKFPLLKHTKSITLIWKTAALLPNLGFSLILEFVHDLKSIFSMRVENPDN